MILAIVSGFLLLFTLGAYALMDEAADAHREERHFSAAQRVHWMQQDYLQNLLYQMHPGKAVRSKSKKPGDEKKQDKEKTFLSPRCKQVLSENAKLNLFPLANKNAASLLLREISLKFLKKLYEKTEIYEEGFEEKVLDSLTQLLQAHPDLTSFDEIASLLQQHSSFFYPLIKGTHSYILNSDKGYPALSDFCTLDPKRPPILMKCASSTLLSALFGERFVGRVLEEEKKKWEKSNKHQPLKKQEYETLFKESAPTGDNFSDYACLLNFKLGNQHSDRKLVLDPSTNILVKLEME